MTTSQFAVVPESVSTFAPKVDAMTFWLLVLCGVIAFGVFLAMLIFLIRYRDGSPADRRYRTQGKWKLELLWSVIPLGIFIFLFARGAVLYYEMHSAPSNATEIYVTGKQWMWRFQHSNGISELAELHVPTGQPVKLIMTSQDVIHSFFVPAFRIKQDVLPGRYVATWFEATRPGRYRIFCTQYCGTFHAAMLGEIEVMRPAAYQQWQATGLSEARVRADGDLIRRGRQAFERHACAVCHSEGSSVPAPRLNGIYGTPVLLDNGTTVTADENYIRESILNPQAKIVMGFKNIMPSFEGQLSEDEIMALIEYIKSQKPLSVPELLDENGGRQ